MRRGKHRSTGRIRSPLLHQSESTYWRSTSMAGPAEHRRRRREMAPAIPCRKTGTRRSRRRSLQNKTDRYSSCDLSSMTLDRQHQVCENASRTRITSLQVQTRTTRPLYLRTKFGRQRSRNSGSLPTPAPAFNSPAVTARPEPRYRPSLAAGLRLSRGRAVATWTWPATRCPRPSPSCPNCR